MAIEEIQQLFAQFKDYLQGTTINGPVIINLNSGNAENNLQGNEVDAARKTDGLSSPCNNPKERKTKNVHVDKPVTPSETMTFKRKGSVLEGHLTLLFNKLAHEGWIEGNEASFKALFSGKRDADCLLTWVGLYGKSTLVELFRQLIKAELVVLKEGYTLSSVLEGHFKDQEGKLLTGLDKGNTPNEKALPVIQECVRLLQTDPKDLIGRSYQEEEDFLQIYDSYDHQDMHLHRR